MCVYIYTYIYYIWQPHSNISFSEMPFLLFKPIFISHTGLGLSMGTGE